MKENDLRNSKKAIPELDENLKESIINKYEYKKQPFKFKLWQGLSISGVACVSVAIALILTNQPDFSPKNNDSINDTSESIKAIEEHSSVVPGVVSSESGRTSSSISYIVKGESGGSLEDYDPSAADIWNQQGIDAGQLTASAINDNDDFSIFTKLVSTGQSKEENGEFVEYYNQYAFKTKNRVKVSIPANVQGKCKLTDASKKIVYMSEFDKQGNAYLYSDSIIDESYSVEIKYLDANNVSQTLTVAASDTIDLTTQITGTNQYAEVIDLMLILDTTGSMSDEISYLKAELANVINTISTGCSTTVNLSILAYRDVGDTYVTALKDFNSDISLQQVFLNSLDANGGGDLPEAVEQAFALANTASWSQNSTKIVLFVADAPAHDNKVEAWKNEVEIMASNGIRIITVASSDTDKMTEYCFRCQSMMTGGTYTYLTNHSGIGGNHLDPSTDKEYTVELANSMLIRLIKGYYTGTFAEPIEYTQDPQYKPQNNQPIDDSESKNLDYRDGD